MSSVLKFCRPLISDTVSDLITKINSTDSQYQYLEVWIDYLADINLENFHKILNASKKEIILLTRRKNLEEPKLTKNKRFEILESAIEKNLIIDCDLRQKNELEFLVKKHYKKILLSFHDYSNTPKNLEKIYNEMLKFQPLIYKFACFCNTLEDSLDLLKLGLMLKSNKHNCIITGMGDKGKLVRLASASWFNEFNFAPINETENTASGQLTIKQISDAIKILDMEI